jgi:hypothetical protein
MPDIFDLTDEWRRNAQSETSPLPIYDRAEITQKDLAKLRGELDLARGKLRAAEKENEERQQWLAMYPAFEKIYPRAWKLMMKTRFFLVVAIDEPYFPGVYYLVKAREMELGTWSEYDQAMMDEALSEHAHLEGGRHE